MSNIDWLSAIGMLLAGAIVAFMFIYSMRGRDEKIDTELRDLEAKRDTLLAALRELADTGGPAEERARLERQTADVLKAIDGKTKTAKKRDKKGAPVAEPQPVAVAAVPVSSTRATIKGFVWGVASFAVIGGIAWFVTQSAKPKDESGMNQAAAMGSPSTQTQSSPQAVDPAVQTLEASVKKTPDDLGLRVQLAKAYLENENAMGTFEQTQYVLERSPNDPKALTYQAIVRIQMGQADQARQMLENANKRDPNLLDASVALAWADTVAGKNDEAENVIADATKRHPEEKQRLTDLLTQMRERQKQAAANPPKAHPAVPPPPAAGAADDPVSAPPTAASNAPAIHITVNVAPTVKIPATAVLWIMARENGQAAGPPLAVKRATATTGAIKIDLSASDSMMGGQPLPDKMRIEARLDLDGNPMTHDPNDLIVFQDGVTAGANVVLNLK